MKHLFPLLVLIGAPVCAYAQSFNLDMETPFGPATSGHGLPSIGFGGAAGSSGFWNGVNAAGFGTVPLRGLDGNLTSVQIIGPQGGGGGGTNLPQNTGDFALLLNDARGVGQPLNFSFSGLSNGRYQMITYAVSIALPSEFAPTQVTIQEAAVPVQLCTGPMPGNQFIQGITHTVHNLVVSDGRIHVTIGPVNSFAYFNGLQIVAVPEPSSFFTLATSLTILFARKKRRNTQPNK